MLNTNREILVTSGLYQQINRIEYEVYRYRIGNDTKQAHRFHTLATWALFSSSQLSAVGKATKTTYPVFIPDAYAYIGSSGSCYSALSFGRNSIFIYATDFTPNSIHNGSSVLLNRHSSLSYPKRFKSDNREVQLTGEAYFEVSKDQKHPFIVQTEHINVQVLGTHFNVDAYRNSPEVKTTLLTGSVAVSNKRNSVRMILKPNEIAIYNKVGNKLTRQVTKNAKDEISWRDGEFIFDNLPLGEIARELSNSFDTPIHIADTSLQSYRISARFRNGEDLETILSVLHHAGYFNYSQNNKQIVITTKPDLK